VVPDRDGQRFVHAIGSNCAALAVPAVLARERRRPMSPLTFPTALTDQETAELKAHHLACSHLVRGCQDAIFEFRKRAAVGGNDENFRLAPRTIEILEGVMESWCETLSVVRSALGLASSHGQPFEPDLQPYHDVFAGSCGQSRRLVDPRHRFAGMADQHQRAAGP